MEPVGLLQALGPQFSFPPQSGRIEKKFLLFFLPISLETD
jgi:hypothetical protein